jgi:hypothetical protein
MADELNEQPEGEEEVLELTEVVETKEGEEAETETEGSDDEEVIVSFGDEAAPASEEAPEWVRDLRKRNRELERKVTELEKGKAPEVPKAGPKPTLWDEGIDGDDEKLVEKALEWSKAVQAEEAAKSEAQKAEEEARKGYEAKVTVYGEQKQSLGVKDFDTAESEVLAALTDTQKAIILEGATNKAQLVYALGKHPEKLRELSSIKNPIEFAFAAAKLEGQTKMERRKPSTQPESRVSGAGQLGHEGKLSDKSSTDEWMRRRNEQVRKPR